MRNALLHDYPVTEAIRSALPLCDHFVVAVGKSDDATLELIKSIDSEKLQIMETVWDDSLRSGGRVLAEETNKAFDAIPLQFDWCLYIQGDECLHQGDYTVIQAAMEAAVNDKQIQGFVFQYRHFYGSYDYVGTSRRWYRREVRIIRNDKRIRSYRDAQGFRIQEGNALHKLRVKAIPAVIYHYGWVRHPQAQQRKQRQFQRLWHSDEWVEQHVAGSDAYLYDGQEPLMLFEGTHPAVMQERIQAVNWQFARPPLALPVPLKERLSAWVEKKTGWRIGEYKNYKIVA